MASREDGEIGVSIAKLGDDDDDARESLISKGKESVSMVLFSTFVAVCGSFEFGSCVSTSFSLFLFLFWIHHDVCFVV